MDGDGRPLGELGEERVHPLGRRGRGREVGVDPVLGGDELRDDEGTVGHDPPGHEPAVRAGIDEEGPRDDDGRLHDRQDGDGTTHHGNQLEDGHGDDPAAPPVMTSLPGVGGGRRPCRARPS